MKKKLIIALSIIVCSASLLLSCNLISDSNETPPPSAEQDTQGTTEKENEEKIKELEAKILSILQSQQLSETERKQEISSLKAEIEKLKNEASQKESNKDSSNNENNSESSNSQTDTKKEFNYILNGYSATITAINSEEETVIIPSVIDGYAVLGIGQEVLKENNNIKRIIISSGITTIDWFAFKNASSLTSISIPSSVTSIGYGVFDGTPKAFTIECAKDSFAMKYAQSYGFKYNTN